MSITVTLPTGTRHEVEPGTTIVAALKAAGARPEGCRRRAARRPRRRSVTSRSTADGELGGRVGRVAGRPRRPAPLDRPPDGAGGEAPVSRHADHHRSGDRGRLLLRLQEGHALHARGSRAHRGGDARDRQAAIFPVVREEMARDEAIALLPRAWARTTRREIIDGMPEDARRSLYRQGEFVDLCRGPHVPSTGVHPRLQAHRHRRRLLARRRAQRDAAAHLRHRVREQGGARGASGAHRGGEEARPPHARQGARPVLVRPVAPGSPFFHPKGAIVYNELVDYVRGLYRRYGYDEVITPQIDGRRAVEALRPLRQLPREHVLHAARGARVRASSR